MQAIVGIKAPAANLPFLTTMAWLDAHRTTAGGKEATRILAINPGVAAGLAKRFAYVGYKGGSEPGVISMTVLIRDKQDRARVVSASWNNPAAGLDELGFVALVARAVELLDPTTAPSTAGGVRQ